MMKHIPIYNVPLLIRVKVLIFQALMSLLLGMMFYAIYHLIAKEKKGEVRDVLSEKLGLSEDICAGDHQNRKDG